jgi:transposase
LRQAGMNKKSSIARTLGVHRHTLQKYSALKRAPQRKPRVRKASALAPYEDYILKRFTDGCPNATQIHKEIIEQGYSGVYNNVEHASFSTSKSVSVTENLYPIRPPDFPPLRQ